MIQSGFVAFHADLEPLMVDIDSVTQHPANYNNGDVDGIRDSIMTSGMYRPIYVQRSTNHIVAGNHTWQVCKELEATQIPVVRLDLDEVQAYRLLVADNRLAALAKPDDAALLKILDGLADADALLGTGYDDGDLEALRLLVSQLENIPLGFENLDEENPTDYRCPNCQHEWNGLPRP